MGPPADFSRRSRAVPGARRRSPCELGATARGSPPDSASNVSRGVNAGGDIAASRPRHDRPWARAQRLAFEENGLVIRAFLRLLALIYVAAFGSLASQITGLIGADGILPVSEYLQSAREQWGSGAYWRLPTLFWFDASDTALEAVCRSGIVAALALFFGVLERGALILCYALYLSLVVAGQTFTEFQWDLFLLESGFLAIFLPFGSRILIWLYRWLLFRFMFMGGVVKLASGDPSWRDLSALRYHFETQPLPSPLAWWAHQFPDAVLRGATASTLVIELLLPLCVFMPRPFRLLAAISFVLLQGMILLTGNYNFFNLLTIALCIFLLDDEDLRIWPGLRSSAQTSQQGRRPSRVGTSAAAAVALLNVSVCAGLLWLTNTERRLIQPLDALIRVSSAFGIVNGYGPFAVVTRTRREIIVEGSEDGIRWQPYEFRYKPGDPAKPPSWNIPHQPRLDWQMWFAALNDPRTAGWLPRFLDRLRSGSPEVLGLLGRDPFDGHPPRYLRASIYRYRFANRDERARTGHFWVRELLARMRS